MDGNTAGGHSTTPSGHTGGARAFNFDPTQFVEETANSIKLTPEHRQELHNFRALAGPTVDSGLVNMLIWNQGSILGIRQQTSAQTASVVSIDSNVKSVKAAAAAPTKLTREQTAEMYNAAKFAMFNPRRRDFENSAIIPSVKMKLKQDKDTNGYKAYYDAPSARTDDIKKAVKSNLSGKTTDAKSDFKKRLTAGLVLNDKSRLSLTRATYKAVKFYLDSSHPTLEHILFMAVLRSFTRTWLATPSLKVTGVKRTSDAASPNGMDASAKAATDYWAIITSMFKERESWGADWKSSGWRDFITDAVRWEREHFPDDSLSLIPMDFGTPAPSNPTQPSASISFPRLSTGQATLPRVPSAAPSPAAHGRSSPSPPSIQMQHAMPAPLPIQQPPSPLGHDGGRSSAQSFEDRAWGSRDAARQYESFARTPSGNGAGCSSTIPSPRGDIQDSSMISPMGQAGSGGMFAGSQYLYDATGRPSLSEWPGGPSNFSEYARVTTSASGSTSGGGGASLGRIVHGSM